MSQEALQYPHLLDDGRRKIHPNQYEEVRRYYEQVKSQRKTAAHFGCSRRLIIFILYPDRLKSLLNHQKEIEHWKKYYNTDTRREYMRKYRDKKRAFGLMILKTKPKKYLDQDFIKSNSLTPPTPPQPLTL